MNKDIGTWVATSVIIDASKTKEILEELSDKYDFLKDGPVSDELGLTGQTSGPIEGRHVIVAEYEPLASSVLCSMKQTEDKANCQVVGEVGNYGTEGCLPLLFKTAVNFVPKLVGHSSSPTKEQMRGIAFEYSDLLEIIELEKQLLDKVVIHLRSCFGLINKLKAAKTIGKLQADKLAVVATDLERSCDAFLIATELNFLEF